VRTKYGGEATDENAIRAGRIGVSVATTGVSAASVAETDAAIMAAITLGPSRPSEASAGRRIKDAAKRLFDIAAAVLLLVLLAPIIVCVSIAIVLDSRGPVFYASRRVGFRGCAFDMLKFRKMRVDASGPALTIAGDERFTRLGRFLAAARLDEIPQLWNVIRGQMSLVGPRPEDPEFVVAHRDDYAAILEVRPGITGLCQLAFAKEAAILDPTDRLRDYVERLLPQKMTIDRLYAANRSFRMDLWILAWTVMAMILRRDVAVHRTTGRLSLRQQRLDRALRPAPSSHDGTHPRRPARTAIEQPARAARFQDCGCPERTPDDGVARPLARM
jgi:lipopolysaccharide/colanic/teichoic acid biosynthesis glycosyltransferase